MFVRKDNRILLDQRKETSHREIARIKVIEKARVQGEFDLKKDSYSTRFQKEHLEY